MTSGVDYWFYAKFTDQYGCFAKDSFKTKTLDLEDPVITHFGPYCINLSNNVQLQATPAGGVFTGPVTPTGIFVPSAAGAGTHIITYTIGTGNCTKNTSFEIIVNPLPAPTIIGLSPFCITDSPDPILTSNIPGGIWSSPILADGTVPISTITSGNYPFTYSVTLKGCTGIANGSLVINPQPSINLNHDAVVCNVDPFDKGKSQLDLDNAILSGAKNGVWAEVPPLSGAINLDGNEYDFLGIPVGTIIEFTYKVIAVYPCLPLVDTINILVTDNCEFENIYPNVITPNSDGFNEELRFNNDEIITNSHIKIYNRWGDLIYNKKNYDNSWRADGFPGGVYYYILTINNNLIKSSLTVIK